MFSNATTPQAPNLTQITHNKPQHTAVVLGCIILDRFIIFVRDENVTEISVFQ